MKPYALESFPVRQVKDEPLPIVVAGIGEDSLLKDINSFSPVAIQSPENSRGQSELPLGIDNPFDNSLNCYDLVQLSSRHVRSMELIGPGIPEYWHDEYGHSYSSISAKGVNFSNPQIFENSTAINRRIAFGLQESAVIRRILKASNLMRQNGIGTEYILSVAEPKDLPWPGSFDSQGKIERLSLREYKRRIIDKGWKGLPPEQQTAETYNELWRAFEDMCFYVTTRAMDTSVRLEDLAVDPILRDQALNTYNSYFLNKEQKPYDLSNDGALSFVREVTSPSLARNMARLHKLGLSHKYPVIGNITAYGSMVDTDSVHGLPLNIGDPEISFEDRLIDLRCAIDALMNVEDPTGYYDDFSKAGAIFLNKYIEEYFEGITVEEKLEEIKRLATSFVVMSEDIDLSHRLEFLRCQNTVLETCFEQLGLVMNERELERLTQALEPYFDEAYQSLINVIDTEERDNTFDHRKYYMLHNFAAKLNELRSRESYSSKEVDELKEQFLSQFVTRFADAYMRQHIRDKLEDELKNGRPQTIDYLLGTYWLDQVNRPEYTLLYKWIATRITSLNTYLEDKNKSIFGFWGRESILDNHRSFIFEASSADELMMSTTGVCLKELVTLATEKNIELTIEELGEVEGRPGNKNINLSDTDNRIVELISGNKIKNILAWPLYSSELGRVLSFCYSIQIQRENPDDYVAVVERKPDGEILLRILVPEPITSFPQALDCLKKYINADQQTLFTYSNYLKN